MTYESAFFVDVFVLVICTVLLAKFGKITHSHPATIYFVFHLATFTGRLFAIWNGAMPLYADSAAIEGATEDEIIRAMLYADIALVAMTTAWIIAANRNAGIQEIEQSGAILNKKVVLAVAFFTLPLGLFGLLTQVRLGGQTSGLVVGGGVEESGYFQILPVWPGLVFLVLIYCYGFRWWLMMPLIAQLTLMGVQGLHRFRVFIPVILLIQIWLDRRGRKWPTTTQIALILSFGLLFFPLKTIGSMVQSGRSVNEIADISQEIVSDALVGRAGDQVLLDEFAWMLALSDEGGKLYWGAPYLAMLTLPIPRAFWIDKPSVADYLKEISRPWRPLSQMGMTVTLIGEAYANFSLPGIVLIPFLLAYALGRAHRILVRKRYGTVAHFTYLLVACNLLQVYRDGLTSIVVFTFVHMMPLTLIVFLQYVIDRGASTRSGVTVSTPSA